MRRASLARRLPVVMAGVAGIAVLIAALVAWPLLTSAADASARAALGRTADLTAQLLQRTYGAMPGIGPRRFDLGQRLEGLLGPRQVTAYLVFEGAEVSEPLAAQDVALVTSGESVSEKRGRLNDAYYVEGRPVVDGVGVLLVQPAEAARDLSSAALGRLALALLLGLAVAAAVGYVVARRLTRALAGAAHAAHAMGSGQRDVRVEVSGPQEVAEIAEALNGLAAALLASEGRQREFLLTVSHELRTPLTSIKGYSEALSEGVVDPADVPAALGVVRGEADHLDRLVSDLLDLARLGAVDVAVNPVEIDLAGLGQDAAVSWSARAGRSGVRFVDEVTRTPMPISTDPVRVRQIIDNLMENALRVTESGAPVVLRVAAEGDLAVVEVRDGGPGLSADDLSVAFVPGELHARYRGVRKVGSGIGLALVDRLAQRLGGRAIAGVAPEGGAVFRVELPLR